MGIRLMTDKPRLHTKSWVVSFCLSKGKEIKPLTTSFPVGIFNPVHVQPERHCIKCTISCVSRRRTKKNWYAKSQCPKYCVEECLLPQDRFFCGCGDYSIGPVDI
jgi:hypothetical protein